MDAHFVVDANRAGNRRRSWPWDQDRNRSRPSVCENRRNLESLAFQLQISRIPIWSCRGVDSVFWCSIFCEPANCSRLPANPYRDRLFTNVRYGALFVGRSLRGSSRNSVRAFSGSFSSSANQQSAISNPRLIFAEGVRFELTIRQSAYGLTNLPMKIPIAFLELESVISDLRRIILTRWRRGSG